MADSTEMMLGGDLQPVVINEHDVQISMVIDEPRNTENTLDITPTETNDYDKTNLGL